MSSKNYYITIICQLICWSIIGYLLIIDFQSVQADQNFQVANTPQPFLGPIYYNQEQIWQVFDHDLPGNESNNVYVMHYNGTPHFPVTATAIPGATATPTNWPPPPPYIPNGYGYNGHLGIDYSLIYEPVLAAASGSVLDAGWANMANHRLSYGLYVKMTHTANGNYQTWYGHLSTLTVETDDVISIDPGDPENRNRILGISGNTGNVFGPGGTCGSIPEDGPNCGNHLHFEVRTNNTNNYVVNPYGWIGIDPNGTPLPDPWATPGAVSYKLWDTLPAVTFGQYGTGGEELDEPAVNNARMIIDDASADFSTIGSCWQPATGSGSYNNGYRRAPTDGDGSCTARWNIRGDAFTVPGDYDVFVHIPADTDTSLSAAYDINHNNQVSRAIAVQAAYVNNDEHNAWAYLGRYYFDMPASGGESIVLYDENPLDDNDNHYFLADAIMLAPAGEVTPPVNFLYVSFSENGYAGNVAYADEDVLLFNAHTGEWQMFFDGSDMGFASVDIDAFSFQDGSLYFSLDNPSGPFDDSDIIRFAPTSFGEDTSGTLSLFMSGATAGLTTNNEDVDAFAFNNQGLLLLSTLEQASVNGQTYQDEDIFVTEGTEKSAAMFFDGSLKQLNDVSEDIDGVWVSPVEDVYLSTQGAFSVNSPGTSGDGADIFVCSPGFGGDCLYTPGLLWNGSAHGTGTTSTVDDFFVHDNHLLDDCETFGNGGFEAEFYCWTATENGNPAAGTWRPSEIEKRSGQFSAEARVEVHIHGMNVFLISSASPVNVNQAYRVHFWTKGVPEDVNGSMQVFGRLRWYDGDDYQTEEIANISVENYPDWTEFDSGFVCPPSTNVDEVRLEFELVANTLFQEGDEGVGSIFIDDIVWESQPCDPSLKQIQDR